TMAYAVGQLVNREAGEDPTKLKVISGRFTGMVMPDSFIKVRLLERIFKDSEVHLHFEVLNGQQQRAISNGYARLSI
ncbi:MAG: hotdog family protein, partial [Desulfocucumaceae bacterium]